MKKKMTVMRWNSNCLNKISKNSKGMVEKITMIRLKKHKGNTDKQRLPIFKVTFTNVKTQITDSVFSDGLSLLMSWING